MNEIAFPRHVVVTGHRSTFRFERCADVTCDVAPNGLASRCGRDACPACGSGGTNVTEGRGTATCSICGNAWLARFELQAAG